MSSSSSLILLILLLLLLDDVGGGKSSVLRKNLLSGLFFSDDVVVAVRVPPFKKFENTFPCASFSNRKINGTDSHELFGIIIRRGGTRSEERDVLR